MSTASPWERRNYHGTDEFCDFVRKVDGFAFAVVTPTKDGRWYWTGGSDERGHHQGRTDTADAGKQAADAALRAAGWLLEEG